MGTGSFASGEYVGGDICVGYGPRKADLVIDHSPNCTPTATPAPNTFSCAWMINVCHACQGGPAAAFCHNDFDRSNFPDELEIVLQANYKISMTANEESYSSDDAGNIPVQATLIAADGSEEVFLFDGSAEDHQFDGNFACASQFQLKV